MLTGAWLPARLLLGSGLLLLAVSVASFPAALLLTLVTLLLVRLLDGQWLSVLQLFGLLRWFVIPILLLHMLFTPGQLLLPGWEIGVSREGMRLGAWLSLHLTAIYTTAMLGFRLLSRREWLQLLLRLPYIGQRLGVHALMIFSMQHLILDILNRFRRLFRLRRDWRRAPALLMAAFRHALAESGLQARLLWLRWPQQAQLFAAQPHHCSSLQRGLSSTLCLLVGCAGLLSPWLL